MTDYNSYDDDYETDEIPDYDKYLVALLPKPMALLSMIGSYVLIREVITDHSKKRSKPISRVLLMMSIADVFFSIPWFLTTWPAPKELDYIWGNVGNTATCTAQGFLFQLGLMASPLFNTTLAFFYLLMVRYSWTDDRLASLEKWIHICIWIFALTAAIIPIPFGLYNNAWEICWIDSYPYDCLDSWSHGDDESSCVRGDNAWIWAIAFTVVPVWVCIFICVILMVMIFSTVRKIENKSRKYAGSIFTSKRAQPSGKKSTRLATARQKIVTNACSSAVVGQQGPQNNASYTQQNHSVQILVNRRKSNAVAQQALCYIAVFFLTYLLNTASNIKYYTDNEFNNVLDYFAFLLLPLQGFFNFLVFARTRTIMETWEGRFLKRVLCCHCRNNNSMNDNSTGVSSTASPNHSNHDNDMNVKQVKETCSTDANDKIVEET